MWVVNGTPYFLCKDYSHYEWVCIKTLVSILTNTSEIEIWKANKECSVIQWECCDRGSQTFCSHRPFNCKIYYTDLLFFITKIQQFKYLSHSVIIFFMMEHIIHSLTCYWFIELQLQGPWFNSELGLFSLWSFSTLSSHNRVGFLTS